MMKSIVDENLVSFELLEQKIFDYVCELGRLITNYNENEAPSDEMVKRRCK